MAQEAQIRVVARQDVRATLGCEMCAAATHDVAQAVFAVLDVETTGLAVHRDRIRELAIVVVDSQGGLLDEYCALLDPKPGSATSAANAAAPADHSEQPTFTTIAPHVVRMLDRRVVVGHNIRFDLAFLRRSFECAGLWPPPMTTLDTLQLVKALDLGPRSWTLRDCCAAVGLAPAQEHSALQDARQTARLLGRALAVANAKGMRTLADLGCSGPPPKHMP